MTGLPGRILALADLTLRDPRAAARALFAEDVPLAARSAGLVLMAVLSAILLQPSLALAPTPEEDMVGRVLSQGPLVTALVQWLGQIVTAVLIHQVGRIFDGKGSLADSVLVVVWLQLMMLAVQVAQLVALVLVPPLAGLIGLAGFVLLVWLMVNFIAELHGFRSLGLVLGSIIVTFFAVAFALAVVLVIVLGPEVMRNV